MKKMYAAGLAAAVALGGTLTTGVAAQAAEPPASSDRGPVTGGAAWLATQVSASGLFHIYSEFDGTVYDSDDVGLTIDGVRAFKAVAGPDAETSSMTTAITGAMPGYYSSFGTTYGNSAAKAASFLLEQGVAGPATTAALTALQSTVSDTAPIAGRIEDQNGFEGGDFASPLGQAYAVQALADAAAPELASAKTYLLAQQCEAGFFRAGFATDKTATDQTCDGAAAGEGGASVDTTAFTILALQDLAATDTTVAAALDEAATWLAGVQGADGSFTTNGAAGGGNANSTGLAGWAMGTEGDAGSAADAALWLRGHQLTNAGLCRPYAVADNGALVVDDLGLANARAGAMDNIDRSVAIRATAQALPALAWARGGAAQGATTLTAATGFVRAGSTQRVGVAGAPGNTLCVKPGKAGARAVVIPASGTTSFTFAMPAATRTIPVATVDGAGRSVSVPVTGLAAKTVPLKARVTTVKQGRKTLVTASGLQAGEKVKLRYRGIVVATGTAGNAGTFARQIVAKGKTGPAKIVVVGHFTDRRGAITVAVVR